MTTTLRKGNQNVEQLSNLDHVTTNATWSAVVHFEDNEAVIKMVIKGSSPTMRQSRVRLVVGQNHFGTQNRNRLFLTPKTNSLTCLLFTEVFFRDEWSNLLRLLNIRNFSMFSRSHFRSIETANTMSKRSRERKTGEEPAFTKPMSICLISRKLLNLKRPSSLGSGAAHVLVNPQLDSEFVLGNQNPATCSARNCNNMQISDYLCVVKVFKTNVLILGLLMSTTMKSSVHLGLQYQENLVADKNCRLRGVQDIVRKNVKSDCGQSFGILNVSTMKNTFSLWMRSLSCHDQVITERKQICMSTQIQSCVWERCIVIQKRMKRWTSRSQELHQSYEYSELSGTDGELIEFEWNVSKDSDRFRLDSGRSGGSTNKSRTSWGKNSTHSDVNDKDRTKDGNSLGCLSNSKEVRDYATRTKRGHWSFFGFGNEENAVERTLIKQTENQTMKPIRWSDTFAESVHPIFRGTSALNRGILRKEKRRNKYDHSTAESVYIEQ